MPPERAHHIMVAAIRAGITPASRLPKILEAWDEPKHEEFEPRTAWSLSMLSPRCSRPVHHGSKWKGV